MLQRINYITTILIAFIFVQSASAQTDSYISLDDPSGIGPSINERIELEKAADSLISKFPQIYIDSFKVIEGAIYPLMGFSGIGSEDSYNKLKTKAGDTSKYYLLIVREESLNGIILRMDLVLPSGGEFSCMSDLKRMMYNKRVVKQIENKYIEQGKTHSAFYLAESEGIHELKLIVEEIKECCISFNNEIVERNEGCDDGCSDAVANNYFSLADFKTMALPVTSDVIANINAPKIKDFSKYKYSNNGQLNYLGSFFTNLVSDVNERVTFNLLVTSSQTFCQKSFQELENFTKEQEFNCWIDIGLDNLGSPITYIKIIWNEEKSTYIKDPYLASLIIKDLYCYFSSELYVSNDECGVIYPSSSVPICPYGIPLNSILPVGGISISQFIQLVKQEESKYTENEQKDTKTMVASFRKLFYGSPAWDNYLITGSAGIDYIKPYERANSVNSRKKVNTLPSFVMVDMGYFPINPSNGKRPEINAVTNPGPSKPQSQEVRLVGIQPHFLVDIGHTLSGMDAYFNPQPFSFTIENYTLSTLSVDRNIDATTWIGDLASAQAEIVFKWENNGRVIYHGEIQEVIDFYASGPDMLGNIDGIVIGEKYCNNNNPSLKKVSSILEHYYTGPGVNLYQNKRYSIFAANIGLTWNSSLQKFSNLEDKVEFYSDQVNDAAAYYVAGGALEAGGMLNIIAGGYLALKLSINPLSKDLLRCFFKKMEDAIKTE